MNISLLQYMAKFPKQRDVSIQQRFNEDTKNENGELLTNFYSQNKF